MILKTKFLIPCLICMVLAYSCSSYESLPEPAGETADILSGEALKALYIAENGTKVSEEELLNTANSVMTFLDSKEVTKSGTQRRISSITPIHGSATKSENDSIPAYAVNFTDEENNAEGYAILSADRRTDDILAIVSDGSLNFNTLEQDYESGNVPEGVLYLMSGMDQLMQEQIEKYQQQEDSLVNAALQYYASSEDTKVSSNIKILRETFINETFINETGSKEESTGWVNDKYPIITHMINTQWGQRFPYNNQTPIGTNGKHQPTGCIATGIAQFLAYHEFPTSYNWTLLKQYPFMSEKSGCIPPVNVQNEISRLMSDIGRGVNMEYGDNASSSTMDDAVNYLKSLGSPFANANLVDFGETKLLEHIKNRKPVLMSGAALYENEYLNIWFFSILLSTTSIGHCWVIDGALRQSEIITVYVDGRKCSQHTNYRTLFDCKFGFEGLYDGYYASNSFNTNEGPIVYDTKSTTTTTTTTTGEKGNYQYELEMILY